MNHIYNLFIEVARTKSFTKASKNLFITPQGISKNIHHLEEEYGCKFFVRSPEGLELTESGKCFLEYAKQFSSTYKSLNHDLERIRQRDQGVVDLISGFGILRLLTPECIHAFQKQYPDIEFHYREFPDQKVVQYFHNDEGNVAFTVGHFDPDEYNITNLWHFPLRLLVHKDHPLNKYKTVSISALKGEKFYTESPDFAAYHIIMEKCRQAGFEPDIAFEASGFSLCHKMVSQNKGVSVTLDFMLDDMRKDTLRSIPFSDGNYDWNVQMLTRKNEEVGRGVILFSQFIQSWMKNIENGTFIR